MKVRTVFFDLGGTLLVMRRDKIFQKVLRDIGYPVEVESVHSAYIRTDPWWLANYGSKNLSPDATEEAYRDLDARVFVQLFPDARDDEVAKISRIARDRWPKVEKQVPLNLYPDTIPALDALVSKGYRLGMVSNAPPDTEEVIRPLGLERYIPHIVVSGAVGCSKPNPEIFQIALRMTGGTPATTVHVGDLYDADVVGARNAGILPILLDRDEMMTTADCLRIRTLEELPGILESQTLS